VTASAVRALRLIGTITAGAADLTTHGTGLSSSASTFSMTKFLAFEAVQWVWYIHRVSEKNWTLCNFIISLL